MTRTDATVTCQSCVERLLERCSEDDPPTLYEVRVRLRHALTKPDRDAADRGELIEALWACMKAAGADTSYADNAQHAYALGETGSPTLAVAAVEAVEELRRDYIEAGGG